MKIPLLLTLWSGMHIVADIDEMGNEVLFHVDFKADEVYDAGELLETSVK